MKKQILLLSIISIIFSCSNDDVNGSQIVNMRVNHYKSTGFGIDRLLTIVVQTGDAIGTNNWRGLFDGIEGFNYIQGNIYDLSVRVDHIDNPPADGNSLKYTLLDVISVQEVDSETQFDINLKIAGESFITTNSGYELLNQIDIDCNSLCDELDSILQNQDFVIGTFKHFPENEIQLIALQ